MEKLNIIFLLLLQAIASYGQEKVHIVYFGEHNEGEKTLHEIQEFHHSYLLSVKKTEEEARKSLLYSYKHSINGFAAILNPEEASKLSEMEEVISVYRSDPEKYSLHTTRSWKFVGLEEDGEEKKKSENIDFGDGRDLLMKARYGANVIVGVLDSGVWPESDSFNDEGMEDIPKSWKGKCQIGDSFNSSHCNRKLIGARYYLKAYEHYTGALNNSLDYRSPRDKDGHGTHTASTVGGRRVPRASALGGYGLGTASGGAPLVRLAIYKACWAKPGQEKVEGNTCYEEDMLAAIDDAIGDGVHVLSISIGTSSPLPYKQDGIAIGSLHALKKNIVVACSAGNSGPTPSTLSNPAPWIITVGASSVDRLFVAPVHLGNGMSIEGQTVTQYRLQNKMYPLVYAADVVVPAVPKNDTAGQCLPNSLAPEKVKGKIVLCMRGEGTRVGKGLEVKRAGGVGFILGNSPPNGAEISVDPHLIPATAVTSDDAIRIRKYIKSTKHPMATIMPARTILNTRPAPNMAAFTSRGPNVIEPNILKPDITAPGLNILAAWSGASSPTKLSLDTRTVSYNFLSGTSMACPHIAAAAALLKAVHPNWSSAAIRSALMTTATVRNNVGSQLTDPSGEFATPFAYGSGHFRPTKAADPGLVYDASYDDYIIHLCSTGEKDILPKKFKCPKVLPLMNNLNYPSLAIAKLNGSVTVTRTVINVGGSAKSVYFSSARPPSGFQVKIYPSMLFFDRVGQKKSFSITVRARREKPSNKPKDQYAFGWYEWFDGIHTVRSPIAVSLA